MSEADKPRPNYSLLGAATILGVCLIVASWVGRPAETGRYQISGESGHICVIDTTTGDVWETWVIASSSEFKNFTKRKRE